MPDLKYGQLFKALFIAGFLGYSLVAFFGMFLANWIALAIGIPVFMFNGWLFYEFRRKLLILKQVFAEELPRGVKKSWDTCDYKITFVCFWIVAYLLMGVFITISPWLLGNTVLLAISFMITMGIFATCDDIDIVVSDKRQLEAIKGLPRVLWKLFKFFFRTLPKFLLKVIILTVHKVHSRELIASSIYALAGMSYVAIFPPFELAPQVIFLMSIGCGVFTGGFGCLVHWILSTAMAQNVFVKVEAWPW